MLLRYELKAVSIAAKINCFCKTYSALFFLKKKKVMVLLPLKLQNNKTAIIVIVLDHLSYKYFIYITLFILYNNCMINLFSDSNLKPRISNSTWSPTANKWRIWGLNTRHCLQNSHCQTLYFIHPVWCWSDMRGLGETSASPWLVAWNCSRWEYLHQGNLQMLQSRIQPQLVVKHLLEHHWFQMASFKRPGSSLFKRGI